MSVEPVVPIQALVKESIKPSAVIASFPPGSFIESIAFDPRARMFVTSHTAGEIHHVAPDGTTTLWATLPVPATGLAFAADGHLFCSAGKPGSPPGSLWRIDDKGVMQHWTDIPDASFLNGMALAPDGRLLVVDSSAGKVFAVDTERATYSLWLSHDSLKPRGAESVFPGANGIKFFGGHAYLSNTDRAQIVRVGVDAHGAAREVEVVAERLLVDDFAFDADGNLYGASHAYNLVVKLKPAGERSSLAGVGQHIVNPTAVAFGLGPEDDESIYVTTTGGVAAPIDGKLQPARIIRVDVGEPGAPLGI